MFLTELHPESLFSQITVLNASLDGELWPTRESPVISLPNELLGYSKAAFKRTGHSLTQHLHFENTIESG